MLKTKEYILLLLIIVITFGLLIISHWSTDIVLLNNYSKPINKQIVYQSITLLITSVFLLVLWLSKKEEFKTHARKGNISAPIIAEPLIGIKPQPKENWLHLGRNFAVIISIVTFVVIYFQLIKDNSLSASKILSVLPFSIVFALSNAFVEESITRLGVVVVLKNRINDRLIPLISAVIFGAVHYWGNPGGLLGVLVAGFLGWFLAKSILETKGIFWAWFIHFLQDLIIFSVVLAL